MRTFYFSMDSHMCAIAGEQYYSMPFNKGTGFAPLKDMGGFAPLNDILGGVRTIKRQSLHFSQFTRNILKHAINLGGFRSIIFEQPD